ncbi:hypothetical protein LX32DRAFT_640066 [Colletotrichum zoysiae]|uniref:Uncharacterized protein n=1 Tax=Colletotrichum zoysiae TaxID=1216348 RepID=A0AAD9M1C8_9PEZI|nr:hypothetical protein LX32DRAFT_640066 [Colletotrichum zoysiae]
METVQKPAHDSGRDGRQKLRPCQRTADHPGPLGRIGCRGWLAKMYLGRRTDF